MKKRNVFAEIVEGFDALKAEREGKMTLRTHRMEMKLAPKITAAQIVAVRTRLNMSQPVFAGYLRTSKRTLENWEQGKAAPNPQASLLIKLVESDPGTIQRLATLA